MLLMPKKISAQDTSATTTRTTRNFKQEIIIGDKRYRVWDNWVNFGVGSALYTNNPYFQLAFGIDFNFHIRQIYRIIVKAVVSRG